MPLPRQDHAFLNQGHHLQPSHRPEAINAITGIAGLAPGPATYSWACCVFGDLHFVYVYGLRAECAKLAEMHHETTIRKGNAATLALAQSSAEAAASALHEIYDGIGSVQAMPVRAFLRQRYGCDLDRAETLVRRT